jgi:folylpolyglutamate synthase/dihydropteroate synthase
MEIAPTVRSAVERALSAPAEAVVFVTGSLYLVGEVRPLLCF